MLKMNLQLFAEGQEDLGFDDDISIPGDNEDLGFDDEEEVNEEETEEVNEEVEENTPEELEKPQTEEQKFKIKYNKEEKELSLTEMQELAQKGMNYDKKLQEIEAYQNNPGLKYMERLAEANGVSVSELVDYYKQQEEQAQLQELVNQNIPEEYAKEMIESRKFREEQKKLITEQAKIKETEEKQKSDMLEFMDSFSDVKPSDISKEVWEKVNNGMSLKQAYMENEFERIKQENKILKQNQSNRGKAKVGGVSNTGNDETGDKYDPFLDGFDNY